MRRTKHLNTRLVASAALLAGLMPAISADSRAHAAEQPHVIFISIDTLRADHLGCYGYERETSPRIDAFAEESVRFEQAFSQASWTLPSHMSMMTSQYPHVHGVENDGMSLSRDATTLAMVLGDEGYHTAAFVSWVYLGKRFGFHKGFREFTELLPPADKVDSATTAAFKAAQVTDKAIAWLKKKEHRKPFFLFVHYFDPHINYDAPEPFKKMFDPDYDGPEGVGTFGWLRKYIKGVHEKPNKIEPRPLQHAIALYDGEIRYTDTHVGRLFDAIDGTVGLENCLIVLTSDHGEEFNEHGSMEGHQWTLYEEVVHVPLIIRAPDRAAAGAVVRRPVELIDIATTILAWLDIEAPPTFQGEDLKPWMDGRTERVADTLAYGEIDRFNKKQFLRTDRYKLIHTDDIGKNKRGVPVQAGYELYDIREDPTEQRNLFNDLPDVAGSLMWVLEQHRRSRPEAVSAPSRRRPEREVKLSAHELERLRSLGYVGGDEEE